jgi:hypothetical protein
VGFSQFNCLIALLVYVIAATVMAYLVRPWWAGAAAGILLVIGIAFASRLFGRKKSG